MRQFHDLDVAIEVHAWHIVMQRQHAIYAGGGADQADQRPLRPHNDFFGEPLQRSGEADELNSVSQPVIAAHEHAFSRQWFAIPDTLKMTRPGLEGYAASKPRAEIGIADLPRTRKISPAHRRHPGVAATYTCIEHRHAGTLQDVKEF